MNEPNREIQNGVAIVEGPCDVEATSRPFGKRWRDQVVTLNDDHIQALEQGKTIAVDVQEEYVVFLQLEGRKEPAHGG